MMVQKRAFYIFARRKREKLEDGNVLVEKGDLPYLGLLHFRISMG